jgi:3-hydroxyacyl-CoA dehydrogenase
MALITGSVDYADLADCDLVVEAVFEDMAVKKEVFSKLDHVARPGAILATNTSYLDVDAIAAMTARPQDVAGTHFFSPANIMKLLEVVRGKETVPDVLVTLLGLARAIGKVPVVVGVCHGFVANRMLAARSAENEDLLLEGATPSRIDKAFTDFGWPMGPFQMSDLAGLDIGWRNRKALGRTAPIADALCERGRFGQKTGKGFYLYPNGSRTPVADPEVEALIEAQSAAQNIARRTISDAEIIERTLYPLINEGAKILEEGIAARASDIDIVWVNGYGFPVGKGGPMFWAGLNGLEPIVERLRYWHGRTGREAFRPSPLLVKLAEAGSTFSGG